ncbi:hypothetical protein DMZ48_10725 [Robertkochia solimangrovi]|nr:hypothetical protein DMZ48_10725 [Robertkochia solimangrovi]
MCTCTDVDVIVPDETLSLTSVAEDSLKKEFHLDKGAIGFMIDVRKIYQKGYIPDMAKITFPDYPQFDTIQPIDKWTSLASFAVMVDSISDVEKEAFADGVSMKVVITRGDEELVQFEDRLIIDEHINTIPMEIENKAEMPEVTLRENTSYLITIDGIDGLLRRGEGYSLDDPDYNWYNVNYVQIYNPEMPVQNYSKFYFLHVEGNRYKIRYGEAVLESYPEDFNSGWWGIHQSDTNDDGEYYITSVPEQEASIFEIETDEDGWKRLRLLDPPTPNPSDAEWLPYVGFDHQRASLIISYTGDEDYREIRFRVLSDIKWEVEALGVEYLAPIVGPVKLDFAFRSILTNCSSAKLTEQVGRTETKSRTNTFTLTEGISLFTSQQISTEVSIELGYEAKVGGEATGGSVTQSGTVGAKIGVELTSSQTLNLQREIKEEETETMEVSRIRTIELPPFTVVDIYDAVKSVDDVVIPFVLKYRIKGTYVEDDRELSGEEIVNQLENNWFDGLINDVNENNVLFTLSGNARMSSVFESSSGAFEIPDGCNN